MSVVVLVELMPRRATDGVALPLRLVWNARARADYLGLQWLPLLLSAPSMEQKLGLDGYTFGAGASPQVGEFQVMLTDATAPFTALMWKGATFTVRTAPWPSSTLPVDPADGDFTTFCTGRIDTASVSDGVLRLVALDAGQQLRVAVCNIKYGTSGIALLDAVAAAAQKGKIVPRGWGALENVPGTLVDQNNLIYLLLGNSAASLSALYDGGAPFTLGVARADLAALTANTPAPGTCDYCLSAGGLTLARPWTRPQYGLSADLTAGGSTTVAGIAQSIVSARSTLTFKTGVAAAFDTAVPGPARLYLSDESTVAEALDKLFAGVGAWWKLTTAGVIDIRRYAFAGTPVRTFQAPQVGSISRAAFIMPTWRVTLGYRSNPNVLSDGDIATSLLIAATDVTYASGATLEALKPATAGADATAPVLTAKGIEDGATRIGSTVDYSASSPYLKGDLVRNAAGTSTYKAKSAVPAGQALTNTVYFDLLITGGGGSAGPAAIQGYLSPPAVLMAVAADGTGGTLASSGAFKMYSGTTNVTSSTSFSVVGSPSWATIGASTGLWTLTGSPGANTEVQFDASYGGVTQRLSLPIGRVPAGQAGQAVQVAPSAEAFTFVDGAASPALQTITFNLTRQAVSGAATWSTSPAVTLGGSGDTRTLSVADMGTNRTVVVNASVAGVSAQPVGVHRLDASTAAAGATVNPPGDAANPNSSFEVWNGNVPVGWTLAGTGTVARTGGVEGAYAADVRGAVVLYGTLVPTKAGQVWSCRMVLGINANRDGTQNNTTGQLTAINAQFRVWDATKTKSADYAFVSELRLAGQGFPETRYKGVIATIYTDTAGGGTFAPAYAQLIYVQDFAVTGSLSQCFLDVMEMRPYDLGATVGATIGAGGNVLTPGGATIVENDYRNDVMDLFIVPGGMQLKRGGVIQANRFLYDAGIPATGLAYKTVANVDTDVTDGATYARYPVVDRTKVATVQTGATVGAQAGTNLLRSNGSSLSDNDVDNNVLDLAMTPGGVQFKRNGVIQANRFFRDAGIYDNGLAYKTVANADTDVVDGSTYARYPVVDRTKVASVATGATVNLPGDAANPNSSFEAWNGNVPVGWTLAGTGTVAPITGIGVEGGTCANVRGAVVLYGALVPTKAGQVWSARMVLGINTNRDGTQNNTTGQLTAINAQFRVWDATKTKSADYAFVSEFRLAGQGFPETRFKGVIATTYTDTAGGGVFAPSYVSVIYVQDFGASGSLSQGLLDVLELRPYDLGATVGAVAGTNLVRSNGTALGDNDVDNNVLDLTVVPNGIQFKRNGVIQASRFFRDAGIYDGGLAYKTTAKFGSEVTFSDGSATSDARLDNNQQPWSTVQNRPANVAALSGNEGILNNQFSMGADGSLGYTNNGTPYALGRATLSGLGAGALATKSTANMDNDVVDGATYARIGAAHLSAGVPKVQIAGSGTKIGDQRNLPPIAAMNLRYAWTGSINYTQQVVNGNGTGTGVIEVGAATVPIGSQNVSYNASSATVTAPIASNTIFYLYYTDPAYSGGLRTLNATTNGLAIYQNDGNVYIGSITVLNTAANTGGGGGTSGGGGGTRGGPIP